LRKQIKGPEKETAIRSKKNNWRESSKVRHKLLQYDREDLCQPQKKKHLSWKRIRKGSLKKGRDLKKKKEYGH